MSVAETEIIGAIYDWGGGHARRPLTPRERQIVELVTSGRSRKEAAFELGIADVTVRVLYARAMHKLGRSRADHA